MARKAKNKSPPPKVRAIRAKGLREAEDRVDRLKEGEVRDVYIQGKLAYRVTA